jgi:hypothetical protein
MVSFQQSNAIALSKTELAQTANEPPHPNVKLFVRKPLNKSVFSLKNYGELVFGGGILRHLKTEFVQFSSPPTNLCGNSRSFQ